MARAGSRGLDLRDAVRDARRDAGGGRGVHPLALIATVGAALAAVAILAPVSLPLLCVGMLPTVGAAFANPETRRHIWISVGALDFAGLFYWLFDLWNGHRPLGYAIHQLATITPILAAYSAAALGWLIYVAMPNVTGAILATTMKRRRASLTGKQKKLVEKWDAGITA